MNDLHFSTLRIADAQPIGVSDMSTVHFENGATLVNHATPRYRSRIRVGFSFVALLLDFVAIFAATFAANYGFNFAVHGTTTVTAENLSLGIFAAILFAILNTARHLYSVSNYLDLAGHAKRTFVQWNTAFVAAAAFGFMLKAIGDSSRGTFVVLYFLGLFSLYAGRAVLVLLVQRQARNGGVLAARIAVVGFHDDIATFMHYRDPSHEAISVVASVELPNSGDQLDARLLSAIETIRGTMPDDIYIVVPWSRTDVIDKCISAFMKVPASIHLNIAPDSAINRLGNAELTINGSLSSLSLRGDSVRLAGALLKRCMDISLSATGLLLLSPLLLTISALIAMESGGPVLFRQRRRGFNKVEFRIFKFRTMTTMEDGKNVKQVEENDPRITRIGGLLRRWNLDELPQLINVLRGEMSIVGPRPHALLHDTMFESEVSLYARRHNVKPGITGWAQVNGFRGRTDTSTKIAERIRYDLHYIDNWSFALDLWIVCLTIFSRRAYHNAR